MFLVFFISVALLYRRTLCCIPIPGIYVNTLCHIYISIDESVGIHVLTLIFRRRVYSDYLSLVVFLYARSCNPNILSSLVLQWQITRWQFHCRYFFMTHCGLQEIREYVWNNQLFHSSASHWLNFKLSLKILGLFDHMTGTILSAVSS